MNNNEAVNIDVRFNPKFLPFFNDTSFYKILYGSAGSGKSHATAQKIVKRCIEEKGHRVWCFRKVSTYVDASVYDTIREVIDNYGVTNLVKFNKTDKTIEFPYTKSIIRCAGLDDQEKIKSIREISIAWLEETTEFFEQDLSQLDIRMRGEFPYYRELIMTFNPVSELHWLKAKFFDNPVDGIKSKLFTLHSTFKDNVFLGDDYIERLETVHSHDPNNYRVYVLGTWGKVMTGMEYYKNFNTSIHVKPTEFDPSYPVHVTFDFNVVPYMTCTIWQIKGVKNPANNSVAWYVRGLKEIALRHPKNSTEDTCTELIEKYNNYIEAGTVLYGDATGRNRKTSSKKTDWMIIEDMLRQYVIDVRVPRSNPLAEERHSFMNRVFYGSLPIVIEIDPEMKLLIEDLSHCLEDGERRKVKQVVTDPISKVRVEKFGHFTDGLDYLVCAAFKQFMQ
jgi:phage terminase large subunit